MPAPDYDVRLLSGVRLTSERNYWQVFGRYDGQRYLYCFRSSTVGGVLVSVPTPYVCS